MPRKKRTALEGRRQRLRRAMKRLGLLSRAQGGHMSALEQKRGRLRRVLERLGLAKGAE